MTSIHRSLILAAGLGVAMIAMAPNSRATAEPASTASPNDTDEAREALARAREATRARDYQAAIEHYEHALRLQPSPKLHFNVAVCHHQLLGEQAQGSPPYEEHRAAAVASYNRYLQAAPRAEDREDVAAMVRALGGTPITDNPEPWTIELVEPGDVPDPPGFDDTWDAQPLDSAAKALDEENVDNVKPRPTPRPSPKAVGPRGRLGVFLPILLTNPRKLAASDLLRPVPALGMGLRGGGFLGPRRRVSLGGELALTTQATSAQSRYRLSSAYLGVQIEYHHPLGTEGRFEIGADGVIGLGSQALVHDGDQRLRCSNNREASRRNGLWASSRLFFAALLGKRRNHELSARIGPGIAAFAAGSRVSQDPDGITCEGEPTAFETFGLPEGAALVVSFDLGYAPRF